MSHSPPWNPAVCIIQIRQLFLFSKAYLHKSLLSVTSSFHFQEKDTKVQICSSVSCKCDYSVQQVMLTTDI